MDDESYFYKYIKYKQKYKKLKESAGGDPCSIFYKDKPKPIPKPVVFDHTFLATDATNKVTSTEKMESVKLHDATGKQVGDVFVAVKTNPNYCHLDVCLMAFKSLCHNKLVFNNRGNVFEDDLFNGKSKIDDELVIEPEFLFKPHAACVADVVKNNYVMEFFSQIDFRDLLNGNNLYGRRYFDPAAPEYNYNNSSTYKNSRKYKNLIAIYHQPATAAGTASLKNLFQIINYNNIWDDIKYNLIGTKYAAKELIIFSFVDNNGHNDNYGPAFKFGFIDEKLTGHNFNFDLASVILTKADGDYDGYKIVIRMFSDNSYVCVSDGNITHYTDHAAAGAVTGVTGATLLWRFMLIAHELYVVNK